MKAPTVLIVDDEPFNRDLIAQELDVLGVDSVAVASGREAIDMIGEHRCDAILLDIMMPGMSGYDVLQWLRDDHRLADLPVIVISAVDDMESVVRCIEMRMERISTPPIQVSTELSTSTRKSFTTQPKTRAADTPDKKTRRASSPELLLSM